VNPMTTSRLQWHCPAPLWARFGPTPAAAAGVADQFRPALLRFASDAFMDELLATLAQDPAGLGDLLARPETWRSPPRANPAVDGPQPLPAAAQERVPLPRVARAVSLGLALRRPRTAVPPVLSRQTVKEQTRTRELPLKLYQPAHQRYYLVSASLVCGITGLPDRAVIRGGSETLGFVLRRQLAANPVQAPDGPVQEYAYVKSADVGQWQRVSAGTSGPDDVLVPGEELLPLFPLVCRDSAGHDRTLWTGLIPVGRREEYLGAALATGPASILALGQRQALGPAVAVAPVNSKMARLTQFKMEVAEPWKALIRSVRQARDSLAETLGEADDTDAKRTQRIETLNLQWQQQSWLILLDLADYLEVHLPQVWQAVADNGAGAPALGLLGNPHPAALYQWLGTATNSALLAAAIGPAPRKPVQPSLRAALAAIRQGQVREGLEQAESLYTKVSRNAADWPDFHFLLAGLDAGPGAGLRPDPQVGGACLALTGLAPASFAGLAAEPGGLAPEPGPVSSVAIPAGLDPEALDRLTALIGRALEAGPETAAPPLPFALQLRDALAATGADQGWFTVRFVYLNADCGPLHPPLLSAPTQRFQLAGFFDPDAPARPIRITLPRDTSPAGLRRHSRGTAFVISDLLCGQIQRAKGMGLGDLVRSVLPWPLHKDLDQGAAGVCKGGGLDIGMICSLSIPIITICALILLMIMVSLLDLIFRWLPYLIICFPVPKLKGKEVAP